MPIVARGPKTCLGCGFCTYYVRCPGGAGNCIGCGACLKGCPAGGRELVTVPGPEPVAPIRVDGRTLSVPAGSSLARALALADAAGACGTGCATGGCWSCAVIADGELVRPCCTGVRAGMEVVTDREAVESLPPRRLVSFFPGHLHASMSVFTHGCNYACGFCHNWEITFSSVGRALTPAEAAVATRRMTGRGGNRRTGISGGEPTLNRRWLVEYVRRLREDSPEVRIQVDTNGSLLTPDYIGELWEAGMTDVSVDLKGLEPETFGRITGLRDPGAAAGFHARSWAAVEHILSDYAGRLHVAAAIPYHPAIMPGDEVVAIGRRLGEMRRGLDVNLIVYQPAFRMRHVPEADGADVAQIAAALGETGVRVWVQSGEDIPPAVEPDELSLSSEGFS